MFKKARIKLTAWYLVIIMLISFSFSAVIYEGLSSELSRIERMQRLRIEQQFPGRLNLLQQLEERIEPRNFYLDQNLIAETKHRLILILLGLNSFIFVSSALAGYFLAGRTLYPIAEMVKKQKDFISDASHELRTPLTSLKSEIEVSLRSKKLSLKEAISLLKSNLEEVNKMQKLSNYLLTLSRYEERQSLPFSRIDLKDVVKEAISRVENAAKRKSIVIVKKFKSVKVTGNKDSLIELVTILLDNAVKYSGKKEKIIIKTGDGLLEVQDFGVGIAKQDLPFIFNRFYRADLSRSKEKTDGYGLGLSIAKSIVDLHGGKIEVKSKLGKGTTVIVRI